jgi:hypothetical protein
MASGQDIRDWKERTGRTDHDSKDRIAGIVCSSRPREKGGRTGQPNRTARTGQPGLVSWDTIGREEDGKLPPEQERRGRSHRTARTGQQGPGQLGGGGGPPE